MHKLKKNNNGIGVPAGFRAAVPIDLEMAALEDLGPMARSAICASALPTLSYSIVSQVIAYNEKIEAENEQRVAHGLHPKPYLDPKQPELDLSLAKGIFQHTAQLILKDGTEEGARESLKVLEARPSARSARERRRTEGRRFRGW